MANTLDIRRRIRSVKNTAQITRAMQMVAASKMRKAQAAAVAGRPYEEALDRVLGALAGHVDPNEHPLFQKRAVKRELIILVTTDKGLCGPLNTNLFRELANTNPLQTDFFGIGRKGNQFLARTRRNLVADFPVSETPLFKEVRPIARLAVERFLTEEVDRVSVLYPRFVNTLAQVPTFRRLLPLSADLPESKAAEAGASSEEKSDKTAISGGFLFEPSETAVLDAVAPHYISYQLYKALLDARASEHSARMVAMKTATDNAKELVKQLTLEYNKVRQASITTELIEITTAQLAIE
ncbi:MAG: ATP synthase F1 subunit gamma [Verrucomicrobia bacterium]|nr:ATP synthase F1 subunit gamma [Verrucomicrobiota bacterium]